MSGNGHPAPEKAMALSKTLLLPSCVRVPLTVHVAATFVPLTVIPWPVPVGVKVRSQIFAPGSAWITPSREAERAIGAPLRGEIGAAENGAELPLAVAVPLIEVAEFTLPVAEATPPMPPPSGVAKSVAVPENEQVPVIVGPAKTSPKLSKNKAKPAVLITPAEPALPLKVRFQSPTTLKGPPVQPPPLLELEELPQLIVIAQMARRQRRDSSKTKLRNMGDSL